MDYDQTTMASVYDAARGYAPETQARWRDVIVSSMIGFKIEHILDLGCGTGRYLAALADWFEASVIGVEPSAKMRAIAENRHGAYGDIREGSAETIPLEQGSVDLIFMSMVFHHIENKPRAIAECRRVLKHGGHVALRAGTAEQIDNYPYTPFFEEVPAAFAGQLQPKDEIVALFAAHGFGCVSHQIIESTIAPDWSTFARKIALRADSTLNRISDVDFEQGLARLNAFANSAGAGSVSEPIDYLVFQLNA